jgi:hypothetical protein
MLKSETPKLLLVPVLGAASVAGAFAASGMFCYRTQNVLTCADWTCYGGGFGCHDNTNNGNLCGGGNVIPYQPVSKPPDFRVATEDDWNSLIDERIAVGQGSSQTSAKEGR